MGKVFGLGIIGEADSIRDGEGRVFFVNGLVRQTNAKIRGGRVKRKGMHDKDSFCFGTGRIRKRKSRDMRSGNVPPCVTKNYIDVKLLSCLN